MTSSRNSYDYDEELLCCVYLGAFFKCLLQLGWSLAEFGILTTTRVNPASLSMRGTMVVSIRIIGLYEEGCGINKLANEFN